MEKEKTEEYRRIQKTRHALRASFAELMAERDIRQITVSGLTERADLSRGTFYQYYQDIYDLEEKMAGEVFEELYRQRSAEKLYRQRSAENEKNEYSPAMLSCYSIFAFRGYAAAVVKWIEEGMSQTPEGSDMALNPLNLMKIKDKFRIFKKEHPDMTEFGKALNKYALIKGTELEIRAVTPEGKVLKNTITLTDNDVEMVGLFVSKK